MKKLRLFTSIFVVCISLAVICFGVFAATQVSYNVGGTISYEVNDCFLDVNTNVYKYTNGLISQEDAQKMFVKCKTFEKVENASFSFKTYDATSGAFDDLENVQQKLDLKFEKCYAFFIVVSVKAYNKDKNITVVIYEPTLSADEFSGCKVIHDFDEFSQVTDVILANRLEHEIENVKSKVYTRDLYSRD